MQLAADPVDTEEFNRKCKDFCTKLGPPCHVVAKPQAERHPIPLGRWIERILVMAGTTCVGKPFKDAGGNPFKDLSKDGPVVAPPVVVPPPGNETAPVSTAAPSVATEVRVVYSCLASLSKPSRRYNGCSRAVAAPALFRWFMLVMIGCAFLIVV